MLGTVNKTRRKDMPNSTLSEAMVKFTLNQIQRLNKDGGLSVHRHDSINIAFLEVRATEWFVNGPPYSMRAHLEEPELKRLIRELEYILRHPGCKLETRDRGTEKTWKIVGPLPREVKLSYANRTDGSAEMTLKGFIERYCPPADGSVSFTLDNFTKNTQYITEAMLKSSLSLPDAVTRFVKKAADEELEAAKRRVPRFPAMTGRFSSGSFDWYRDSIRGCDMGSGKSRTVLTGLSPSMIIMDDPMKEEKVLKKVNNPYYVASPNVTTPREQDQKNIAAGTGTACLATPSNPNGRWTRPTVDAAIEHANEMLAKDPSLEHVAIVKIVRVVRRPKIKNVVEVIK
jgi:hypothetical protein